MPGSQPVLYVNLGAVLLASCPRSIVKRLIWSICQQRNDLLLASVHADIPPLHDRFRMVGWICRINGLPEEGVGGDLIWHTVIATIVSWCLLGCAQK